MTAGLSALLARELPVGQLGLEEITVHHGDEVDRDLLGACFLSLAVVRAGTEEQLHGLHHVLGALVALGLALGEQVEVRQLG